ncbi:hypothetical protein AB0J90_15515 [Micromonospora sp. NPDC049523]|uniref:hypothetical protein n=1 Tax=Micromonospora sp. NPDC049523 TaxID=3155921 RepID=UPI0034398907
MFGFGRRKSHGQLIRTELGEGFGHIRQAAGHAAEGVGATVGPRVQVARGYLAPTATKVAQTAADGWGSTMTAIAPLAVAALAGARQAGAGTGRTGTRNLTGSKKKMMMKAMPKKKRKPNTSRRRWTMLTGLLAAGAVAGAVGAVAMRRRHQEHWETYEPLPAPETSRSDGRATAGGGLSSSAGGAGRPTGETAAGATKPKPVTIEKVRDRTAVAGEKISTTAGTATDGAKSGAKPDGLLGTGSGAGNSRS